jgi:hypothetical protein
MLLLIIVLLLLFGGRLLRIFQMGQSGSLGIMGTVVLIAVVLYFLGALR